MKKVLLVQALLFFLLVSCAPVYGPEELVGERFAALDPGQVEFVDEPEDPRAYYLYDPWTFLIEDVVEFNYNGSYERFFLVSFDSERTAYISISYFYPNRSEYITPSENELRGSGRYVTPREFALTVLARRDGYRPSYGSRPGHGNRGTHWHGYGPEHGHWHGAGHNHEPPPTVAGRGRYQKYTVAERVRDEKARRATALLKKKNAEAEAARKERAAAELRAEARRKRQEELARREAERKAEHKIEETPSEIEGRGRYKREVVAQDDIEQDDRRRRTREQRAAIRKEEAAKKAAERRANDRAVRRAEKRRLEEAALAARVRADAAARNERRKKAERLQAAQREKKNQEIEARREEARRRAEAARVARAEAAAKKARANAGMDERRRLIYSKPWSKVMKGHVASHRLAQGMTPEQVRLSWGAPKSVSDIKGGYTRWSYKGKIAYFKGGLLIEWQSAR